MLKLLIVTFLPLNIFAQTIINQAGFGGDHFDVTRKIHVLDDGSYILTGESGSAQNTGNKTSDKFGSRDYWVVKMDANFNKLWDKSYGGTSGSQNLSTSIPTSDGNIVLCGRSNCNISGNKTENSLGGNDYWIVKLDNDGNILWQKTIGASDHETPTSIIELQNGDFLISGDSFSDASSDKTEDGYGGLDVWFVRLSADGSTILWDKTIGGDQSDKNPAVAVKNDKIYCSGRSVSGVSGLKTTPDYGSNGSIWSFCMDLNGNILWQKSFASNGVESLAQVLFKDDYLYTLCLSDGSASYSKSEDSYGSYDLWLIKSDTMGNIIWDRTYGGTGFENFPVIKDIDNQIYLGCRTTSGISGNKTTSGNGSDDIWIVAIDTSSNIRYQYSFGGGSSETLSDLVRLDNGNMLFFGGAQSDNSGDVGVPNYGLSDYWVFEVDEHLSLDELNESFSIYPNPAEDFIKIQSSSVVSSIDILDQMGRVVHSYSDEIVLNIDDLQPGQYFMRVFLNGVSTTKKFIKR